MSCGISRPNPQTQGLTLIETKPIPPASYQPASIKVMCRNPRSRNYGQFIPADDEHALPMQILPEGFSLDLEEEGRYLDLKRAVIGVKEPWAREFHFHFNSAEGGRDLRVLYYSDEGLARYCVTYLQQGVARRWSVQPTAALPSGAAGQPLNNPRASSNDSWKPVHNGPNFGSVKCSSVPRT